MNWMLPIPRLNGTTRRNQGSHSIRSRGANSNRRISQTPSARETPCPARAPVIPPAACPPSQRISAIAANRPAPSRTKTHPRPRKFCRPCSTPFTIGAQSEARPISTVTQSAAGFMILSADIQWAWAKKVTPTIINQM